MSDLICKTTMMRCHTPGMCSPHGGCQPDKGFEGSHIDLGKFVDWVWMLKGERDQLKAENERLRNVANELRRFAACEHLHHDKADQHELDEPCKVIVRIDAAMRKEP